MHDHSLGGMVDVGVNPDAEHSGPCNDGVYGCSRCWNAANKGEGTISECDWCKKQCCFTRVTKAWDEPVSYALCEGCQVKNQPSPQELDEIYNDPYDMGDDWYDEED